jgi:hypothetical protein
MVVERILLGDIVLQDGRRAIVAVSRLGIEPEDLPELLQLPDLAGRRVVVARRRAEEAVADQEAGLVPVQRREQR